MTQQNIEGYGRNERQHRHNIGSTLFYSLRCWASHARRHISNKRASRKHRPFSRSRAPYSEGHQQRMQSYDTRYNRAWRAYLRINAPVRATRLREEK